MAAVPEALSAEASGLMYANVIVMHCAHLVIDQGLEKGSGRSGTHNPTQHACLPQIALAVIAIWRTPDQDSQQAEITHGHCQGS